MNAKNTGTTIDYTIYYMIIIYQYIIKRLKFISTDITPKDLSFLEPMLKKKNSLVAYVCHPSAGKVRQEDP